MSSVSRSVGRPVTRSVLAGQLNNLTQLIKTLFSLGEQGFAYDPNDLTTMFQDAAGTIPITGAGQAVGLIKDKSGRNNHAFQTTSAARPIFRQKPILGANFVSDSTLSDPSKWNTNVTSGVSVSGNKLILSNVAAYNPSITSQLSTKLTTGKQYLLSYSISEYVSGTVRAQFVGGASVNTNSFSENGRVSLVITATAEHTYIGFQSTVAGTTLNISEVYLQEIIGYRTDQNYIEYDKIDDKLTTNLPAQLTGCTVIRSVPNVGTQILTGQTIPATYNDNTDHCGLIVINRALTATETSQITKLFNKAAGV